MKTPRLAIALVFSLTAISPLMAQDVSKRLSVYAGSFSTSDSSAALYNVQQVSQLQDFVGNDDWGNAIRIAKNGLAQSKNDTDKKTWQNILTELEKARAASLETLTAKTNQFLAELETKALIAKSSKDLDPLIDQLQDLQNSPALQRGDRELNRLRQRLNNANNFLNQWANYLDAGADGNVNQQFNILNSLISDRYYRFADPAKLRAVRGELQKTVAAQFNQALQPLMTKLSTAKTAQELDAVKDDVDQLYSNFNNVRSFYRKIESVRRTVEYAANIAAAEQQGNYKQMANYIRNLNENSDADLSLLPKGWLDAKTAVALDKAPDANDEAFGKIDAQINRWFTDYQKNRDIKKLLSRVNAYANLLPYNTYRDDVSSLRDAVKRVQNLQNAVDSNSFTSFNSEATFRLTSSPWAAQVDDIYQQALTAGIVKYYGLKDFPGQIKKGERATDAVIRRVGELAGKRDWKNCLIYLNVIHDATRTCNGKADFESLWSACNYYQQGMQLKDAGENELAIQFFQKVLAISGDNLPRKEAIDAIKQARAALPKS
jgi:hypothetical protein